MTYNPSIRIVSFRPVVGGMAIKGEVTLDGGLFERVVDDTIGSAVTEAVLTAATPYFAAGTDLDPSLGFDTPTIVIPFEATVEAFRP